MDSQNFEQLGSNYRLMFLCQELALAMEDEIEGLEGSIELSLRDHCEIVAAEDWLRSLEPNPRRVLPGDLPERALNVAAHCLRRSSVVLVQCGLKVGSLEDRYQDLSPDTIEAYRSW